MNTSMLKRQFDEFSNYEELYNPRIAQLQEYLKGNGFYSGNIDGMLSPEIQIAIDGFLEYLEKTDMRKLTAIEVIDNTIDAGGEIIGGLENALTSDPELEKIIKNFEINGKIYKVGAKTFSAVGDTAMILSIIGEVTKDLKDDGILGKRTIIELASQGASQLGGMIGASTGAMLGKKIVISISELIGAGAALVTKLPMKAGKEVGGSIGKGIISVFTIAGSIMVGTWASNKSKEILDQVIDISPN